MKVGGLHTIRTILVPIALLLVGEAFAREKGSGDTGFLGLPELVVYEVLKCP